MWPIWYTLTYLFIWLLMMNSCHLSLSFTICVNVCLFSGGDLFICMYVFVCEISHCTLPLSQAAAVWLNLIYYHCVVMCVALNIIWYSVQTWIKTTEVLKDSLGFASPCWQVNRHSTETSSFGMANSFFKHLNLDHY